MKSAVTLTIASLFVTAALTSCGTGKVDVRYPTVQQLDDLDVQWGLSRRVPRGGPSRTYSYDPSASTAGTRSNLAVPPNAPQTPPAASAPPSQIPRIPDQLR